MNTEKDTLSGRLRNLRWLVANHSDYPRDLLPEFEDLALIAAEMEADRESQRQLAERSASEVGRPAERDALRQACWDARAIMGFDNDGDPTPAALSYPPLAQLIVDNAREFRRDYDELSTERDRLAARCTSLEKTNEGLEKLLHNCRDNYVEPELRLERLRFKGYENCSNIPALESDLAAIDAALPPPASDATDSTDGETK